MKVVPVDMAPELIFMGRVLSEAPEILQEDLKRFREARDSCVNRKQFDLAIAVIEAFLRAKPAVDRFVQFQKAELERILQAAKN